MSVILTLDSTDQRALVIGIETHYQDDKPPCVLLHTRGLLCSPSSFFLSPLQSLRSESVGNPVLYDQAEESFFFSFASCPPKGASIIHVWRTDQLVKRSTSENILDIYSPKQPWKTFSTCLLSADLMVLNDIFNSK